MVQTAAYSAVLAAETGKSAANGTTVDAAVAAAHRTMLKKLIPSQQAAIDTAYNAAIAALPDTPDRASGIERGERAANAVLAQRAADNAGAPESYRPHASAGAYVPTVMPAVTTWPQRKPWLMTSPAQFRPDAPLHPEYPSAHSSLAGAVSAVLKAELGAQPMPALATSSPTAKNQVRRWTSLDAFAQEVANSRIYAGIHYRASTEVGQAMGERIGALAAARLLSESSALSAEDAGTGAGASFSVR
jgi:hypothetical protein